MRLIIGFIAMLACVVVFAVPVAAQERRLQITHTIEIEVECVQAASEAIRELRGHNLHSYVFIGDPQHAGFANFTRRVEFWAFRHAQEVLRGLGEVHFESEHAHDLTARLLDIEVRIAAASREMERLTAIMAASTTLDVLIVVDSRISQVARRRDNLLGTRNMLIAQAGSPVLNIRLFETPEDPPEPVPLTFGRRISDSFIDSWDETRRIAGNFTVFIARISVPLVIWLAIAAIALLVAVRLFKKWRAAKVIPAREVTVESKTPEAIEISETDMAVSNDEESTADVQVDLPRTVNVYQKEGESDEKI